MLPPAVIEVIHVLMIRCKCLIDLANGDPATDANLWISSHSNKSAWKLDFCQRQPIVTAAPGIVPGGAGAARRQARSIIVPTELSAGRRVRWIFERELAPVGFTSRAYLRAGGLHARRLVAPSLRRDRFQQRGAGVSVLSRATPTPAADALDVRRSLGRRRGASVER